MISGWFHLIELVSLIHLVRSEGGGMADELERGYIVLPLTSFHCSTDSLGYQMDLNVTWSAPVLPATSLHCITFVIQGTLGLEPCSIRLEISGTVRVGNGRLSP